MLSLSGTREEDGAWHHLLFLAVHADSAGKDIEGHSVPRKDVLTDASKAILSRVEIGGRHGIPNFYTESIGAGAYIHCRRLLR